MQTTRDPARGRRLAAFADTAGFPVVIRGLASGVAIERTVQVRSVTDGLQAAADWAKLVASFCDAATHVVSNTGVIPATPSKRSTLWRTTTWRRHASPRCSSPRRTRGGVRGRDGVTLLPCELVRRNGRCCATL
ncbi:hypothetical protein AB5I41_27585 [Sphingomonas sp. MMS24-JH45]